MTETGGEQVVTSDEQGTVNLAIFSRYIHFDRESCSRWLCGFKYAWKVIVTVEGTTATAKLYESRWHNRSQDRRWHL